MSTNAVLAFLAGAGGGYVEGKRYEDQKAREDRLDQMAQEEHDARMQQLRVALQGNKALQDAAKPVTVNSNAALVTGISAAPTVYDDADVAASDVRQANQLAQRQMPGQQNADGAPMGPTTAAASAPVASATPAIAAGGQAYPDMASAQAAAASANTPQAIRARQIAALNGIDPERALTMQAADAKVQQAQQAVQEQALKLKQEGVFQTVQAARAGDAQGVFDSFNKQGNLKLAAVPTVTPEVRDIPGVGKVTTYTYTGTLVNPDGTTTPFVKNSHDLSMEVMPYEKALALQEDGQKNAAEMAAWNAHANYYNAAAHERQAKADGTIGGDKPYKLDEDDKLRLTNSNKALTDAQKAVQDALGKLMPGDDPTKNPAVVFAQNNLRQAKLESLRTNIELGQIPASSMATQILGVAKSPQEALQSLSQIGGLVGPKYTDQVAAEIQNSDQWKQWTTKPAPKAQPVAARAGLPTPLGAPGVRPTTTTTVAPQTPQQAQATLNLGQRLDAAREALRRLLASRPPITVGRQALDDYGNSVRAAQDDVDQLSSQYQALVQNSVPAYIGYRGVRARPAAATGMAIVGR